MVHAPPSAVSLGTLTALTVFRTATHEKNTKKRECPVDSATCGWSSSLISYPIHWNPSPVICETPLLLSLLITVYHLHRLPRQKFITGWHK